MTLHEWDFNTALGDTVREKAEGLWSLVHSIRSEHGVNFIVSSPQLMAIFETSINLGNEYIQMGNFVYVGKSAGMAFFKTGDAKTDEFILCGPSHNAVIKVTNFFEEAGDD